MDNNQKAFIEILRAGLWEKEVWLSPYKDIDFSAIMRLAEEQSVVGLVAAGLEHVVDAKVPQAGSAVCWSDYTVGAAEQGNECFCG